MSEIKDVYSKISKEFNRTRWNVWANVGKFIDSFKSNTINGDIGCGNGDFLEYASSLGMKVIGIDIDENSLLIARSRGLKDSEFHNTTLIEFAKSEEIKFDFISMFEVFEHLDNPNETIQIIKNLLKKDGVFIGTLPNERRFCAKSLNLEYALPPYHLTFWIRKTWTKYLELNGFTTITCANTVYYGYLCDILYFRVLKSFQEIRKRKFLTFSTKVIFTIIKPIEAIIEKITKRSSSFYFEFQSKN